ncbi:hypothetical protein [Streptomyces sp. WZ.A104]|uniref:hypothetical protein n=1 Tax=Streptomyces sp. WZ.A104 TaxID=2023771 RepID=UPI00117CA68E|nr:hypothetical protein [Streptomyces sp. WZ.A104]
MDPEVTQAIATVLVAATGSAVAAIASGKLRGLLRAIFRRPRETSVIVEVDGKRVELSGEQLSPEAVQALIQRLRDTRSGAARAGESEKTSGGATGE